MPTLFIAGASRGIGLEFVRQYAAAGWNVIATVRDEAAAERLRTFGDVRTEFLDMRDMEALASFGARVTEPLDLVIANAGIAGPDKLRTADEGRAFLDLMAVNAVAPTLLANALAPNVIAARGKLVAITSQMGSIADNNSGGWLAYRASKAALNQAWKTLAVDLADEPISIAMLHPGWVKTDMGGGGAPLEAPESVSGMRRVIEGLSSANKAAYLNYKGETLPW